MRSRTQATPRPSSAATSTTAAVSPTVLLNSSAMRGRRRSCSTSIPRLKPLARPTTITTGTTVSAATTEASKGKERDTPVPSIHGEGGTLAARGPDAG